MGIVVVVVVVIVVLALLFSGAIPGFKLGSSSSSTPSVTSFKTALSTANSTASSRGGSWVAIAAVGVDSVKPLAPPSNIAGLLGLSCPVTNQSSSVPSLPAYSGSYSSGDQTGWIFFLFQSSSSTLLLLLVIGSSTTTLGTIVGASCFSSAFDYFTGASGVIDSPAATSAVASDASSFLSTYSTASSVLFFISGYSITEGTQTFTSAATWTVDYTNCSINATSGTGSEFSATVNGTAGTVTTNGGVRAIACDQFSISPTQQSKSTPLGSALSMGSPTLTTGTSSTNSIGCRTGDYCYDVLVEQASAGLTFSAVGLEVKTVTGVPYTGTVSLAFDSIDTDSAATVPAICAADVCNDGGSTTGWTFGTGYSGSTPITTVMHVVVDMGTSNPVGQGFELVAIGQAAFSGTVAVNLP